MIMYIDCGNQFQNRAEPDKRENGLQVWNEIYITGVEE